MSILILSTGAPSCSLPDGPISASDFESAVQSVLACDALPPTERKIAPGNRRVHVAPGKLAASSAEQILTPCEVHTEPLLHEIPLRASEDSGRLLPYEKWLRKAAAQRKAASPRQPESRADVWQRCDALIRMLEEDREDSLLICYPLLLSELLERFRVHNYVIQRSGLLRIQPWEKIVVSRKDEHCGGCQHNCFLSNPGCGVGRDKAMRRSG